MRFFWKTVLATLVAPLITVLVLGMVMQLWSPSFLCA